MHTNAQSFLSWNFCKLLFCTYTVQLYTACTCPVECINMQSCMYKKGLCTEILGQWLYYAKLYSNNAHVLFNAESVKFKNHYTFCSKRTQYESVSIILPHNLVTNVRSLTYKRLVGKQFLMPAVTKPTTFHDTQDLSWGSIEQLGSMP